MRGRNARALQECGDIKLPRLEKETEEHDELINSTITLPRGKVLPIHFR